MSDIELAWEFAKKVHEGQTRFDGSPYTTHLEGVVSILKGLGVDDETMIISAILHDTIEDGKSWEVTQDIFKLFGNDVGYLVKTLSIKVGQSYEEYVQNVLADKRAVLIKIADSLHNVTDKPTSSMRRKYRESLTRLIKELI